LTSKKVNPVSIQIVTRRGETAESAITGIEEENVETGKGAKMIHATRKIRSTWGGTWGKKGSRRKQFSLYRG